MTLPEPHLCARCRRPLDWHQNPDRPGWWTHPAAPHPIDDDHDPDPIPASRVANEMVGTCDFCAAPHPEWCYPCDDFTVSVTTSPDYGSVGDWAACRDCHDLIERGHFDKLARKAVRSHPARVRPVAVELVAALHAGFRAHRGGPPHRL